MNTQTDHTQQPLVNAHTSVATLISLSLEPVTILLSLMERAQTAPLCPTSRPHNMNFLRSQMLTTLPEAENRVSPEGETRRFCTTVSELEPPLPEGGLVCV